jgi:hypothetical protein
MIVSRSFAATACTDGHLVVKGGHISRDCGERASHPEVATTGGHHAWNARARAVRADDLREVAVRFREGCSTCNSVSCLPILP